MLIESRWVPGFFFSPPDATAHLFNVMRFDVLKIESVQVAFDFPIEQFVVITL